MKIFTFYLLITVNILAINFNAVCQNGDKALEYMKSISEPMSNTKNESWQYLKAVTRGKGAKKVEKKRQNLLVEIRKARSEVNRQRVFEGDTTYKSAIVDYLNLSYKILNEDYGDILDMEEIAEQSYDLMEAYMLAKEKAGEKFDEAFESVKQAQETFAAKYNITLISGEDDKMTKKIKQANEALAYYNEVYLIFFKSHKQEVYVLNAYGNNDLNGLAQNINSLSAFSDEGIEKLKDLKSYQTDIRLKRMAMEMLQFYKNEAEVDFVIMSDFLICKDNFEKTSKLFNSKSKKKRTQEDCNNYNKAVEDFNNMVNKSNETSNKTYEKRNELLKKWNKTANEFFDNHS
jgi:uncharacterized protein YlxW (UPF0749 family)